MTAAAEPDPALQALQLGFNASLAQHLSADSKLVVALSGGMDSMVLLDLAARQSDFPARAIHVNHGLQDVAADWGPHCASQCAERHIEYTELRVTVQRDSGRGLEAAARDARYKALAANLEPGEVLLTAHHLRDQGETFLLQLLRGAGVKGLSAMPDFATERGYPHLRPLLKHPQEALREYADAAGLQWVEDPSNELTEIDRNYLRHEVLPVLRERWPAVDHLLARSARHSAESAELNEALAKLDMGGAASDEPLAAELLRNLALARRKNLFRFVLRSRKLPVPGEAQLMEALRMLLDSRIDAEPEAAWPGVRVRRFADRLWFYPEDADPLVATRASEQDYVWVTEHPLDMGEVRGVLTAVEADGQGLSPEHLQKELRVRFRAGGERIRPLGSPHTKELKKLLQEANVLPWMRGNIPLVYSGEQLIAVADLWVADEFAARPGEPAKHVKWACHARIS